jgi:hypothetical protein
VAGTAESAEVTIASRRDGGDEVLDISGLVPHDLHGVDLALPAGEIVGVTWLIGSRIAQPGSVVFGALPRTSGTVWAGEREVPPDSAAAAIAAGMGFVPADRRACGVLASLAGLLFTARLGTADLTTGPAYLAPKNVSASVRPLVEGGLLTRNLIPRTGRAVRLQPTDRALANRAAIEAAWGRQVEVALAGLDEAQRQALQRALGALQTSAEQLLATRGGEPADPASRPLSLTPPVDGSSRGLVDGAPHQTPLRGPGACPRRM